MRYLHNKTAETLIVISKVFFVSSKQNKHADFFNWIFLTWLSIQSLLFITLNYIFWRCSNCALPEWTNTHPRPYTKVHTQNTLLYLQRKLKLVFFQILQKLQATTSANHQPHTVHCKHSSRNVPVALFYFPQQIFWLTAETKAQTQLIAFIIILFQFTAPSVRLCVLGSEPGMYR